MLTHGEDIYKLLLILQRDNYQRTGCYNVQCRGFIQIHSQFYIGQSVGGSSIYGGEQFQLSVMIKQVRVSAMG